MVISIDTKLQAFGGEYLISSLGWLIDQVDAMTDDIIEMSPSEWAEEYRYLPKSTSQFPGYYDYDLTPYLREIVDCFDVRSPVREVSVKKGAQIGATVGILENVIGYCMMVATSSPVLMVTADDGLAKTRMEKNITPMIQDSKLSHLVQSIDRHNARKSGKTDRSVEWRGGGWLIPMGAQNPDKMRSISAKFLLEDENEAWPEAIGNDGDPQAVIEARTKGFYDQRKIARLSTPAIAGQSRITRNFEDGDQRYYQMPCKLCKKLQVLRFKGAHETTGKHYGLIWKTDFDGRLVPGSVRYVCKHCGHEHVNADKTWMLATHNGAMWVATATAKSPDVRSYHISGLMAPPGFFSWEACVLAWLDGWDVATNKPRDLGKLQEFYNNVLGECYEMRGQKLHFSMVSEHRRSEYQYGEIPNHHAVAYTGYKIGLLTMSVDVHDDNLAIKIIGWAAPARAYVIEEKRLVGTTEDKQDVNTWGALRKIIRENKWYDEDGREYWVAVTLIDAGYKYTHVCEFCHDMGEGSSVYPILGKETLKDQAVKEFNDFVTKVGITGYNLAVNVYKDRMAATLRKQWDGKGLQPYHHYNVPSNTTDKQLKELTVEYKREKIRKSDRKRIGFEWHRPSGSDNEGWDLYGYCWAGLDMCAWDICINQSELESVNYEAFWQHIRESDGLYYVDP